MRQFRQRFVELLRQVCGRASGGIGSSLFKYQSTSSPHALQNLASDQIWFSKPTSFNDPFDCNIPIHDVSLTPESDLRKLYNLARGKGAKGPAEPTATELDEVRSGLEQGYNQRIQTMLNNRGVCCFSTKNDDLLMWGHYADGHRGFCLEFDWSTHPFSDALEVRYETEVPRVNPADLLLRVRENKIMRTMITTKARAWSYEAEWRLLHEKPDKAYRYSLGSLKAIYLGIRASAADRAKILTLAQQRNTPVFSMVRPRDAFRLDPV